MYSRFISITSLWEISISPLSRRLTAYLQRPCCLQVLYHVPAKRSIPFAGLFIACSSWQSSLFRGYLPGGSARCGSPHSRFRGFDPGMDTLRISAPATSRGRAAHGGARGSAPSSLRSRSQIFRIQTRSPRARISVYPLARASPRPAIITSRLPAASALLFLSGRTRRAVLYLYKSLPNYYSVHF